MGVKTSNSRTEAEIAYLLEQLSNLPKATNDAAPEQPEQRSTKWRHKSHSGVASNGRVNKTKGK